MKSHATDLKLLPPLLFALLITGCATRGPVIKIVTEEPADDFVVVCNWMTTLSLHGGGSSTGRYPRVVKSGEKVDCGRSLLSRGYASVMHPVYVLDENQKSEIEDGVTIIRPITKLQKLDELKDEFESGKWDKYKNPGVKYSDELVDCNFNNTYLNYYSQVKEVDVKYFKNKYHVPLLDCLKIVLPIRRKYLPHVFEEESTAEELMNRMWESKRWSKYQ